MTSTCDQLRLSATEAWEGLVSSDVPVVTVGTATCGRSAGALETLANLREDVAKRGIECRFVEVGCLGPCYAEPLVTVQQPGQATVCFASVDRMGARKIAAYLDGEDLPTKYVFATTGSERVEDVPDLMDTPMMKGQVRRVLRNCGIIDPGDIRHSLARGGYRGLDRALEMDTAARLAELERSGLRGRGGAGFPLWRKWTFCIEAEGDAKYIICNADEGDPGAFMNRSLLEGDPHAVLEGMIIAGLTIGAAKGYIYCRAEYPLALERLDVAIRQAEEAGLLGPDALGPGRPFRIQVKEGAGAFVCGEETALIASLEGRRGMPRPRPPFPAVSGLWGRPTVINNVETLASVGLIFQHGADWFAEYGTEKSKGTKTFALVGNVLRPGLVEVPLGTTLRQMVFDIGGGVSGKHRFKAVQTGGPSGGCLPEDQLDIPVDYESLLDAGTIMGSGGIVVMDERTCMVDFARYFLDFAVDESCGKCGPCRLGTWQLLRILEDITQGKGSAADIDLLEELGHNIIRGSLCGLGTSAPNPVLTTLRYFRDEYVAHVESQTCPALACRDYIAYQIDEELCTGCTVCAGLCPVEGISGTRKEMHHINEAVCTKCGVCSNSCTFDAVRTVNKVDLKLRRRRGGTAVTDITTTRVRVTLDGKAVEVDPSATVLEAALENDVFIPHLCHHPDLIPAGVCRLCFVDLDGRLVTACNTPVADGATIRTDTDEVKETRLGAVELLLVNHHRGAVDCEEGEDCELREIARFVGVDEAKLRRLRSPDQNLPADTSNPFFEFDPNICVLCGICVRTCDEIVGVAAIDFVERGVFTTIGSAPDTQWIDSDCVSCGECVVRCPTGSLSFKEFELPEREVITTCTYCGCGCGIHLGVTDGRLVSARGVRESPANEGRLCVKGRFGFEFVNAPDRLKTPWIRRNGALEEATWDEALDLVAKKFSANRGASFAAISSAKLTNEENYLVQKFTRAVQGTNTVDHCARLCHSPSVAGLVQSLGSGAATNSTKDMGDARCVFSIGSNTTAAHPIIALQVLRAKRQGGKLIVANPREIELAQHADLFIQHNAGSDVALLMGMMRVILDEGLHDAAFIESRCENFEAFQASLAQFGDATVEAKTGVPFALIAEAARMYAENAPASILYAMGITQHTHGTDNVLAISNLALLTGNVGQASAGVNPLRGQSNVQGACDMGALPNVYPGYQKVDMPEVKAKFEQAWGVELDGAPGLTHLEILRGVSGGRIKAIYLVGENPALSEADATHAREAMEQADFLVVQDIFMTESARYADVVLPAASFAEKDGTFTNAERRVQRVRKAIEPVGDCRTDLWITCEIAKRMGAPGFDFETAAEVMGEIASLAPIYGGITHDRIEEVGLQWPCPDKDHPGTRYLHGDQFPRPGGRGRLFPLTYRAPDEEPDEEYPLVLTTERSLYHYHTSTMTRRVPGLEQLRGEELVEMHPQDASALRIASGDEVRVTSRRGEVVARALVTEVSPPGTVSMTFHFHEAPTNVLTNAAYDPVAKIPETKVCAVRVERVS